MDEGAEMMKAYEKGDKNRAVMTKDPADGKGTVKSESVLGLDMFVPAVEYLKEKKKTDHISAGSQSEDERTINR